MEDDIDIEDLIEEEECVFTLTSAGYIKRLPASHTYRAQRRGGKGISAQTLKEEDMVGTGVHRLHPRFHPLLHQQGRVHRKKGYQIRRRAAPPRAPTSSTSCPWRATRRSPP